MLTTIAAANLTLIYLPFAIDDPASNFAGFLPVMAIGIVPAGFGQVLGERCSASSWADRTGYALTLYQFTFLAAVAADGITLVVALTTRADSRV